jgi:hypothetical protein
MSKKKKILRFHEESYYERFTKYMAKSPILSITMATILVIIGMITAAFVNMVSGEWKLVKAFVIYGGSGLTFVLIGFVIFKPYWEFRRNFYFLEEEGKSLAEKLVGIYNRAHSIVTTVDGILAFQLFKVERHTNDEDILFSFEEVMSHKTKGFDLSPLKIKKFKVPVDLFEWLRAPQSSPSDYGPFLNRMIYDWMTWQSSADKKFEKWIQEWDVQIDTNIRVIGAHYVEVFDFVDTINSDEFKSGDSIDCIYENDYNGFKEKHSSRKYFTVRIFIDGGNEGSLRCTALIIANAKLSTSEAVRVAMERILNGGVKYEKDQQ